MNIELEDVVDLARGAAILGTGGGGDPYLGGLMLREALLEGYSVSVIDVESIPDDALTVPFGMMGAPTVIVEKIPNGAEMVAALRTTERYLGEAAQAVMCAEIGGLNALVPLVLAARCGLPVLDGDGMGRAFPQLQMTTYHIFGVPAAPMIMADEYSNTVLIQSNQATEVERLGRQMVVAMGGSCSICLYTMHGRDAKRCMVRGTISLALGVGRVVRNANRTSNDPIANLFEYLRTTAHYQHCRVLFQGRSVDLQRETKGGFSIGHLLLEGNGDWRGRRCEVQFQNEHLIVREGEKVLAIVPDLIAILDTATAEPITTEALKYGQRVTVVGISAAPIMRTPEALSVFGPRSFGLTENFVPLEEIHP